MAEYIDRKKYMKDKYNCDLIQIDNVELVPLRQIIDKLEQSIERSKINKAIQEIEFLRQHRAEYITKDSKICIDSGEVLEILKRVL